MGLLFDPPARANDPHWQKLHEAVKKPVPQFEMYLNAQILNHYPATSAVTKVPFDTLVDDYSNGAASVSSDDFTCIIPGLYMFTGCALTGSSIADTSNCFLNFYKNGNSWKRLEFESKGAAGALSLAGSALIRCSVGDVIDLRASFPGAATKNADPGRDLNYFQGAWISP